jgi:predicted nucleotidyltransferase component of viral defense system
VLSRDEINSFGPPGFSLGQKEKDYVQHWILSFLARSGFKGVFKGGTALQKAFALPRYSEDLDFALGKEAPPDFDAAAAFLESAGFSGITRKTREVEESLSVKMRVRGPLYNGKELSECSITLEFSKRENPLLETTPTNIRPPYSDLMPYVLRIMNAREITAEKIRAVLTRESARDLYDLHFLVRRGETPSLEVVNEKLGYAGKTYSAPEFKRRVERLAKTWGKEIAAFVPQRADYALAKKDVLKAVRKIS